MMPSNALERWLALEQEAVWTYSFLGARVDSIAESCRGAEAAHRKQRDRLLQAGVKAAKVHLSYDLGPITNRQGAVETAQSIERRIQAACIEVIRQDPRANRELAVAGLRRAALAEVDWGAPARAYPGLAVEQPVAQ